MNLDLQPRSRKCTCMHGKNMHPSYIRRPAKCTLCACPQYVPEPACTRCNHGLSLHDPKTGKCRDTRSCGCTLGRLA